MAIGLPLPPQERLRLEVDELVLRPWRENDASKLAAAYQDDPEIPRRTGFAFEMTEEQAAGYIAKRRDGWRAGSTLAFGVFDASDRLLGSVSLLEIHRYELEAEVGYWVARPVEPSSQPSPKPCHFRKQDTRGGRRTRRRGS